MRLGFLVFTLLVCMLSPPANGQVDLESWDSLLASAVKAGFVDYRQWRDNEKFNELVHQALDTAELSGAYEACVSLKASDGSVVAENRFSFDVFGKQELAAPAAKVAVLDPENPGRWLQEAAQPPLYYLLMAALTAPIDTSDLPEVHWVNKYAFVGDPMGIRNKGAMSDEDLAWFRHSFCQPGAATASLNYYRALVRCWLSVC